MVSRAPFPPLRFCAAVLKAEEVQALLKVFPMCYILEEKGFDHVLAGFAHRMTVRHLVEEQLEAVSVPLCRRSYYTEDVQCVFSRNYFLLQ